jgi:hypothetical protein
MSSRCWVGNDVTVIIHELVSLSSAKVFLMMAWDAAFQRAWDRDKFQGPCPSPASSTHPIHLPPDTASSSHLVHICLSVAIGSQQVQGCVASGEHSSKWSDESLSKGGDKAAPLLSALGDVSKHGQT